MHGIILALHLIPAIVVVLGQSLDKHMVCKEITDVFAGQIQSGNLANPGHGRPGKSGPPGPKGDTGPPGPSGNVVYEEVREIVRQEMQGDLDQLKARVKTLETLLDECKEDVRQLKAKIKTLETVPSESKEAISTIDETECLEELKGILYNGSCLWAEEISQGITLSDALATCNRRTRSKLPEIYGESEYLKMIDYLRSNKRGNIGLAWTAMTRNHATGQALMSDGSVAPYQKIRSVASQWTAAESRRTNVYLQAVDSPSSSNQGMGSIWPEFQAYDLLCLKD